MQTKEAGETHFQQGRSGKTRLSDTMSRGLNKAKQKARQIAGWGSDGPGKEAASSNAPTKGKLSSRAEISKCFQ